jgi:Heterokaryon incompatibility protein (HET)
MTGRPGPTTFQYRPLGEGELRLLRACDDEGAEIEIVHAAIADAPKYIAFSYRWGPEDDVRYTVSLDGHSFEVRRNLHDALKYLAGRVRRQNCPFWVDSICINQGDLEERTVQVRHMTSIFSIAAYIYCWLGVPDDEEENTLAAIVMRDIRQLIHASRGGGYDMPAAKNGPVDIAMFLDDPITNLQRAWCGIAKIFTLDFWTRVWVYQEATCPTTTYYIRGNQALERYQMEETFNLAFEYGLQASKGSFDAELGTLIMAGQYATLKSFSFSRRKEHTFLELL